MRHAAVVGDPVAHSLSPAIHRAAFAATGLECRFEAVRAGMTELAPVIERARREHWWGLSVTMPDKQSVIAHLDGLTPAAERLDAVNCVFWDGDRLLGDNTDGAGLLWALRREFGLDDLHRAVAVLGAGGAARACIVALSAAGAADIVVVNRSSERADDAAALGGAAARVGTVDDLRSVEIVVNATSVGMVGAADGFPTPYVPGEGVAVMDLIYHPVETEWLAACRRAGARGANGVSMLVGQAAVAFERWTGMVAPVDAMAAVVEEATGSPS